MSIWGTAREEMEAGAEDIRRDAKIDGAGLYVPAVEIVRMLGGEAHNDVPRGMHGVLEMGDRLRVGYRRGSPIVETRGSAHEGGHLVLISSGLPNDEDDANEAGKCLILPPDVCRELVHQHGWDPFALARVLPDVPLSWTLGRVAVTQGGVAILRPRGGRRLAYAADGITIPPELQRFEREYAALAAQSPVKAYRDLYGITTYSMGSGARGGTVMVADPAALALLAESNDRPEVSAYFGTPLRRAS